MNERDFYDILVVTWLALAAVVFIALWFTHAPYGRFARPGFGPELSPRPAWIIMESPAVFAFLLFFVVGKRHTDAVPLVLLTFWMVHYLHRTCVFPLTLRGNRRQFALLTVTLGLLFNLGNAYLNSRWLFSLGPTYPTSWLLEWRFVLGTLLFWAGFVINKQADATLIRLRGPGEMGYRIPRGGLYEYVSCPNYLGEIIQWAGWALACFSPGGFAFLAWTTANLVPRAFGIHRWYHETFADYPKDRKALIPFIG
jgi:protein-S-isoprenylcysteine O-methyltransferase Ste14